MQFAGSEKTWIARWTIVTRLPGFVNAACASDDEETQQRFMRFVVQTLHRGMMGGGDRRKQPG